MYELEVTNRWKVVDIMYSLMIYGPCLFSHIVGLEHWVRDTGQRDAARVAGRVKVRKKRREIARGDRHDGHPHSRHRCEVTAHFLSRSYFSILRTSWCVKIHLTACIRGNRAL
jgi:hypothetical protein